MGNQTHNKDTFVEYLEYMGYSGREIRCIDRRISEQRMTREDKTLFLQYASTKEQTLKRLYDL